MNGSGKFGSKKMGSLNRKRSATMAGKPSMAMVQAMKLVIKGVTPYKAAQTAGIALATMYRSALYKAWREGIDISDRLATKPARRKRLS
jgi:hypothetical protein